jgi:hypothetical protein
MRTMTRMVSMDMGGLQGCVHPEDLHQPCSVAFRRTVVGFRDRMRPSGAPRGRGNVRERLEAGAGAAQGATGSIRSGACRPPILRPSGAPFDHALST